MYNPFILEYLTGYQPTEKELQEVQKFEKMWFKAVKEMYDWDFGEIL